MNSKCLLLSLLVFTIVFHQCSSSDTCWIDKSKDNCGTGCTGKPTCDGRICGNVDNMCYCDCNDKKCKTPELGYKWNHGAQLKNGSYALNGTKGDGGEYVCSKESDHIDVGP